MTERKSKQRKIKPAKVVAPLSAITEEETETQVASPIEPVTSEEITAPSITERDEVKQAKPAPKSAPAPKKIASSPFKGVATKDRCVKVVAITNSRGRFGNQRYQIKDGETYTFSAELAKWLIDTGRAK